MMQLDHIILGVPDLETARVDFQKASGVLPDLGGNHPSLGTHNALVSLGSSYFEFLSVDPTVNSVENSVTRELKGLLRPKLLGWAIQTDDFTKLRSSLKSANLLLSDVGSGRRRSPNGTVVAYEFAMIVGCERQESILPFFIKWQAGTIHPATSSPGGCSLQEFSITGLTDSRLESFLRSLNLNISLLPGVQISLAVNLKTPRGVFREG